MWNMHSTSVLEKKYSFRHGSPTSGIDLPELNVDLKVTSTRQPQSSCPFRDAAQKAYGLGYRLIVFIYEKADDSIARQVNALFLAIELLTTLIRGVTLGGGVGVMSIMLVSVTGRVREIGILRVLAGKRNNIPLQFIQKRCF